MTEKPGYEDPTICEGFHSWMYVYDPASADSEWKITATCHRCARVETWDEHIARKPATLVEGAGMTRQILWLFWHETLARDLRRLHTWLVRR